MARNTSLEIQRVEMTIKQKVERVAGLNPSALNSDKKLLLEYWKMQGFDLSQTQKQIFLERCTTPESITRARRELRLEKGLQGSEEVEEERYNKYQQYKHQGAVSWLND